MTPSGSKLSLGFTKGLPLVLSARARSIWAKSCEDDHGNRQYLQLWQHMEDTGDIALLLWDHFLPDHIKELLSEDLGGVDRAKRLLFFIAVIHDVGKASPAFVVQCDWLTDRIRQEELGVDPHLRHDAERKYYRHELVGYQTIEDWFERQGFISGTQSLGHGVASIVAGHHGTSITEDKKTRLNSFAAERYLGNTQWADIRFELLDWAAQASAITEDLKQIADRPLRRRSQILLTGVVILADWIASNAYYCPLNQDPSNDEHPEEHQFDAKQRAKSAWRRLALPKPWHAGANQSTPDELFAKRFNLPGAHMRPVQRAAVEMSSSMDEPGLMIIEANMGEGKTEAALIAAEILASRFDCGGVYYALPSQATVNAMFTRILAWIDHLPSSDQIHVASMFLAHGKRELNPDYQRLRERHFDGSAAFQEANGANSATVVFDDGDDSESTYQESDEQRLRASVNSWLTGRKKGNLADFVVGTIDQVLMAGLRSKHVVLRHLAFAGKVVVLDEIHSNTAYMNVYMETVLSWLGAYHVPVVMLSATLPRERREAFLKAYHLGGQAPEQVESLAKPAVPEVAKASRLKQRLQHRLAPGKDGQVFEAGNSVVLDKRYPMVSVASAHSEVVSIAPSSSGRATDIRFHLLDDSDEALVNLVRDKLRSGGCVVIIRNTVKRAQASYELLRQHFDVDIQLAHSKFLGFDRARIDRDLIKRFGKDSTPKSRQGIVVATQVVEQSLDVDFDLMITDLAPIDLVLQRVGRLHRHRRGIGESDRPELLRKAECYITGVGEWKEHDAPLFDPGAEKIYTRYLLMRSLVVLGITPERVRELRIPDDIPQLVQTVYADIPLVPEEWRSSEREAYTLLEKRISNSKDAARWLRIIEAHDARSPFALDDWLDKNIPDPDVDGNKLARAARASVREGDDSFEVIVLQRNSQGDIELPVWGDFDDDAPLPANIGVPEKQQVRDIMSCTLSLSLSSIAYQDMDEVIAAIEQQCPQRWFEMQQDRDLSGQLLVLLDAEGRASYRIEHKERGGTITMRILRCWYSAETGWKAETDG
ncbi:CRISPR-associated helicase Cas3' [Bifidobacterium psychraerophilum]|uniref:CRISPR-associated helicase Cas3' n=1 Tax=Bifidobacterium psychraerophilum TaxID=218140 RepID=UPI0039EB16EA